MIVQNLTHFFIICSEGDVDFFNPDERQRKALFFTRVEPHHGYINVEATCRFLIIMCVCVCYICLLTVFSTYHKKTKWEEMSIYLELWLKDMS